MIRFLFFSFQTGNLVLNGQEYKLEPAMDEMAKRELPTHLGTPHTIEALTNPFYLGGISDHPHGGKVVTAHVRELIDYVTRKYTFPTAHALTRLSRQSFPCPHKDTFHPWLSKMCPV